MSFARNVEAFYCFGNELQKGFVSIGFKSSSGQPGFTNKQSLCQGRPALGVVVIGTDCERLQSDLGLGY